MKRKTALGTLRVEAGPKPKSSGPNIPNSQRRTEQFLVRCPDGTAARLRTACAMHGLTYAEIIELGLDALADKHNELKKNEGVMKTTIKNLTEAQIGSLERVAGQAGDVVQACICQIALKGAIDTDDYNGLTRRDIDRLRSMTQEEAYAVIVDVINDNEVENA